MQMEINKEGGTMFKLIKSIQYDVNSVFERDPAARTKMEVLFLYPHIKALIAYKIANSLYKKSFSF